mmetsp:Transcript_6830/g.15614  ORF Transcript_6830/g.15614 Transcript_6830/m.15614 type:complete len:104 (-) Transcript_6830:664-975(-)
MGNWDTTVCGINRKWDSNILRESTEFRTLPPWPQPLLLYVLQSPLQKARVRFQCHHQNCHAILKQNLRLLYSSWLVDWLKDSSDYCSLTLVVADLDDAVASRN